MLDLLNGRLPIASPLGPTLEEFADGFYRWPDASFIKRQLAKGRSFGKAHADLCQGYLDNWIVPAFGKRSLRSLSKKAIDEWLVGIKIANSTKNHILYAFRAVLQDAVDDGKLEKSPLDRVEALGSTAKPRDVFSVADYAELFPPGPLEGVWGSQRKGLFFLILAGTGIRSGECRALSWRQVLWTGRALLIDRACIGGSLVIGPVSDKKGGSRIVLMPSRVQQALRDWENVSLWKRSEDLVFPGKSRDLAMSAASVSHALTLAIGRLEKTARKQGQLPPISREGRSLVVHSFRHTWVTRMKRLALGTIVPRLVGHHNEETTNLYDHPTQLEILSEMEPARQAVESLL